MFIVQSTIFLVSYDILFTKIKILKERKTIFKLKCLESGKMNKLHSKEKMTLKNGL